MISNVGVSAHEGITRKCQEHHKVITKVSQLRLLDYKELVINVKRIILNHI